MTMGHRMLAMHSLSGFDANHMPEAIMGIDANRAMKFSTAVMLLLTPISLHYCLSFVSLYFGNGRKIGVWTFRGGTRN